MLYKIIWLPIFLCVRITTYSFLNNNYLHINITFVVFRAHYIKQRIGPQKSLLIKWQSVATQCVIEPSQARAQQGSSSARKIKGWLELSSIIRQALTIQV